MSKDVLSRRRYLRLLGQAGGLALSLSLLEGLEQTTPPLVSGQTATPIFKPPLAGPPGPATWFVHQWYGNTRWAYRQRHALYSQGQGLHFGIDFYSVCGTPVVAIGDGTILSVDGPYGSPPHNVLVKHANGLVSLYGHLLNRSTLRVGQSVRQGEPVGTLGAPSGADCDTRAHVHLELRNAALNTAYNPIPWIEADWPNLPVGFQAEGLQFQLDFDHPDRWQTILDQPTVRFGGPLLNDYARTWP